MRFLFASLLLILINHTGVRAQEVLPGFSASIRANGKVLISWKNTYPSINQISIQRSTDSLRNFTTVMTVPDPRLAENGFVDTRAPGTKVYYRMFILFGNSKYLFTKSRQAVADNPAEPVVKTETPLPDDRPAEKPVVRTGNRKGKSTLRGKTEKPTANPGQPVVRTEKPVEAPTPPPVQRDSVADEDIEVQKIDNARIFYPPETRIARAPAVTGPGKITAPTIRVERTMYVKRRDSLIRRLDATRVRYFSDSLIKQTKDTLLFVNADTLLIKPYIAPPAEVREVYKASPYVFTAKDGNINIALSDFRQKKYAVKFFEEDQTLLLQLGEINNGLLIIDKTNFMHAGWFRFELYEDGKLKEKNKLYIPKDF